MKIYHLMKKILLIALWFLLASADSSTKDVTIAEDDAYTLIFSDEFNQKDGSLPDTTKWSCPPRTNAGWSRWIADSPKVAFIKNGKLVCRAIPNKSLSVDTATMLTGAVFSRNKFEFRYGKIEVRMKTNLKVGNFPAAWLRTWATKERPLYSEIDIMEVFGNRNISAHTAHSQLTMSRKKHGQRNTFNYSCDVTKWHVYGVIWTENHIIWTVDGLKVGEYRKSSDAKLLAEGQWSFDYPLFIVLNQSVGTGSYDFFRPQLNEIYETQFDWVRVYQKKKTSN